MNKITIIRVITCFIGSILIVFFLQVTAVGPNQRKNNFIRLFPSHFFGSSSKIDLKKTTYYIAGVLPTDIFLGNYSDPRELLQTDRKLSKRVDNHLQIPGEEIPFGSNLHISMDSEFIYINNYLNGSVFRTPISHPEKQLTLLVDPKISTSIFLPITSSSFAVRVLDGKMRENRLAKLSYDSPFLKTWPNILEKQEEGIFSTDGILQYNPTVGLLVYIYSYRNQFICLDTGFRIRYRSQTLDTNTQAKIRVVSIPGEGTSAIASPGFRINRAMCVDDHWIYINSDLKADNEEKDILSQYDVMDVYSLSNGHYHFSFYLPKGKGKITDLAIIGNTLFVLEDHFLSLFSLNMKEIKN